MYTLESLPLIHVWLDADQLASTAQILMDGYKVPAIGIVDSNHHLVGWVTALELVGSTKDTKLSDVMVSAPEPLPLTLTIRDAAGELIKHESDFLPVEKGGHYFALVTARSLLGKLRESYDPMTELPWSDALREWGVAKLEQNIEVAILFIDLDHFGQFNKQYGHVYGDRVIQKAAAHLKSKIDQSTDILVRYGGDEFAIGTIRNRDDAETLMNELQDHGGGLIVDEISQPITFTIGIYGGLRTKIRNNVHGASNLDNLVNLASKDCLAKKSTGYPKAVVEIEYMSSSEGATDSGSTAGLGGTSAGPSSVMMATETETATEIETQTTLVTNAGPVIETIQADDEPGSLTYVVLKSYDKLTVGVSPKMGSSKTESIAIATAKALEKAYPDAKVTIDSINVERAGSTELVTARVRTVRDHLERDVTAQAEANGDLDETIGLVVISAFLAE